MEPVRAFKVGDWVRAVACAIWTSWEEGPGEWELGEIGRVGVVDPIGSVRVGVDYEPPAQGMPLHRWASFDPEALEPCEPTEEVLYAWSLAELSS